MKKTALFLSFITFISFTYSQNIIDWRGPGRTGVYQEKGLQKKWKEDGPDMLWSIDDLPKGYSTVSVTDEAIYFTGIIDSSDYLIAVDLKGKLLWKTEYGRSWNSSFNESRCTPTIQGNKIYVSSGLGDLACIESKTGTVLWALKASDEYKGTYGRWGISESLLILDNKLFYTPGGEETTIVALDKETGMLIWKSKSLKDKPSYTSPLLIERDGKKQIVTLTENYVIGVNPENGKIEWKYDFGQYAGGEYNANNQTNTPIYYDGKIFVSSGYDHKSVMLNIDEKLKSVEEAWVDSTLDIHHGGAVKTGDYLYGANWLHNRMGKWVCLEWETGKVMYEHEWENKGSIISAEGMLYCYDEKKGNIALVKANPEKFDIVSSFKIKLGTGPHWGHPVIKYGVLYIRHEDALMAFDIKEK